MSNDKEFNPIKWGVIVVCLLVAALLVVTKMVVTVSAGEIIVKQGILDGKLTVWNQPGVYFQNFGSVTTYKRSFQYSFSASKTQGDTRDESIKIRWNDGAHSQISGTVQIDNPIDKNKMAILHMKFHSQEAVEQSLVRPTIENSLYMTAPLFSSKESAAEKRNDFKNMFEDQLKFGICSTFTHDVKVLDPISNSEKTVSKVELVKNNRGGFVRQEASPFEEFGIRIWNLSINGIVYDKAVEDQIAAQQKLAMDIQTAMSKSREAEQAALTAAKVGEANAAKAKWEIEVIKAKNVTSAESEKAVAITKAEQEKSVAELTLQAAEFTKKSQIALGEGNSRRMKLEMDANGALEQKLATYEKVNLAYAEQLGKQPWVPQIMMGGNQTSTTNGMGIMEMLQLQTAKQLGLDMGVKK